LFPETDKEFKLYLNNIFKIVTVYTTRRVLHEEQPVNAVRQMIIYFENQLMFLIFYL